VELARRRRRAQEQCRCGALQRSRSIPIKIASLDPAQSAREAIAIRALDQFVVRYGFCEKSGLTM
jgi:hypothetical protein